MTHTPPPSIPSGAPTPLGASHDASRDASHDASPRTSPHTTFSASSSAAPTSSVPSPGTAFVPPPVAERPAAARRKRNSANCDIFDQRIPDPLTDAWSQAFAAAHDNGPFTDPLEEALGATHAASFREALRDSSDGSREQAVKALLDTRPLRSLSDEEFEGFLYWSRMYPSRSRFMPGNAEWVTPRRDITVRVALETLRERMQQAAASVELVARLERDYEDENLLPDDDEAVVVSAAVRDNLREALGMLGVIERALERGTPNGLSPFPTPSPSPYPSSYASAYGDDLASHQPQDREARESAGRYQVLALAA